MKRIIPQLVSVILPVYNEQRDISDCLSSLLSQSYKHVEIIVVDDGSTDNTTFLVKKFPIRIYRQLHLGSAKARNLGASKARGKILVFIDADMTFDKFFLEKLVQPILGGKAIGTFSKDEYVSNWENPWSKCWNLNRNLTKTRMLPDKYPDSQPVFRAILRSKFDEVGGFDSVGYNDDWTLARKLGTQAVNAPGAVFFHRNPNTLTEVWLQASWVGKREYKSRLLALVRASLPMSIIVGLTKSIFYGNAIFLVFKLVYDLAIFTSIVRSFLPNYSVAK